MRYLGQLDPCHSKEEADAVVAAVAAATTMPLVLLRDQLSAHLSRAGARLLVAALILGSGV